MEKNYIIEKIDIFVFIVGVILTIIDEMKKIPFYKLGLAMVMLLVLYVFPLILIIRFLKNPRKGEGFALCFCFTYFALKRGIGIY